MSTAAYVVFDTGVCVTPVGPIIEMIIVVEGHLMIF